MSIVVCCCIFHDNYLNIIRRAPVTLMSWWSWQQDMDDLWAVVRGMSGRLSILERDCEEMYHRIHDLRQEIMQDRDLNTSDCEVLRKHLYSLLAISTDLKAVQTEIGDIARSRTDGQPPHVSRDSAAMPMPSSGPARLTGRPKPSCAPYLRCRGHISS